MSMIKMQLNFNVWLRHSTPETMKNEMFYDWMPRHKYTNSNGKNWINDEMEFCKHLHEPTILGKSHYYGKLSKLHLYLIVVVAFFLPFNFYCDEMSSVFIHFRCRCWKKQTHKTTFLLTEVIFQNKWEILSTSFHSFRSFFLFLFSVSVFFSFAAFAFVHPTKLISYHYSSVSFNIVALSCCDTISVL